VEPQPCLESRPIRYESGFHERARWILVDALASIARHIAEEAKMGGMTSLTSGSQCSAGLEHLAKMKDLVQYESFISACTAQTSPHIARTRNPYLALAEKKWYSATQ
jgi:hypothetical protein